jgi:flagellar motor switch protein FliM
MSGFLDNKQIEALFERASEGNLPMETETPGGRRARWLRTVDFTRPTKFSTDQERRIRRALDNFAQVAGTRLSAEHRTALDLEVIDVQQLTWSNGMGEIPDHSVFITIDTAPHEARMLLTAELPLICVALERLLGGRPETANRERALTDIDLMLVRRFTSTIVESLSSVWFDISEVRLSIDTVETQSEMVQVAAGSEPTLALTMEARLEGLSSTMTLLVPYAAIAPVASAFSRRDDELTHRDPLSVAAVHEGLSLVDVTLRAEVADTTLSLEQILALKPGDVVTLDAAAENAEATLFADRTPVHRARAGRSGKHRAVQITAPADEAGA